MSPNPIHVVIIGGGIGGLCLAQGLKKAGVSAEVYERDHTPASRLQGYRININSTGSHALRECLPVHLYEAFLSTCGQSANAFHIYTEKMKELLSVRLTKEKEEAHDSDEKAVSRLTLRQVLLAEMDEVVYFDKKFTHYKKQPDGEVEAFFEDGTSATGDVLIAADGVNSEIRKQFLPYAKRMDTGIVSIVGKIPLTKETQNLLPADTLSIVAPKGVEMSFTTQEFKHDSNDVLFSIGGNNAASKKPSGLLLDNTKDYIMWGIFARKEKFSFSKDPFGLDNTELQNLVLTMIKDWDPFIQRLVRLNDTETTTIFPIYSSVPIDHWETTNITLLGDAIHSMTPMNGMGANMALRDAQLLCNNLISANCGEKTLIQALCDYEIEMVQYGFDAVRLSLKTAEQSTSNNIVTRIVMKTLFRLINTIPPLKHRLFGVKE